MWCNTFSFDRRLFNLVLYVNVYLIFCEKDRSINLKKKITENVSFKLSRKFDVALYKIAINKILQERKIAIE